MGNAIKGLLADIGGGHEAYGWTSGPLWAMLSYMVFAVAVGANFMMLGMNIATSSTGGIWINVIAIVILLVMAAINGALQWINTFDLGAAESEDFQRSVEELTAAIRDHARLSMKGQDGV